jgi:hypothetical protein
MKHLLIGLLLLVSLGALAQKTKRFSLISGGSISYAAFQNAVIAQEWSLPNGANGNVYGVASGTFNPVINYQFGFRYHAWASQQWGLVLGLGQRMQGIGWQGAEPERWGHYYTDVLARWSFRPGWYALGGGRTDWDSFFIGSNRDNFLLVGGMPQVLRKPPLWQAIVAVGRDFKLLGRDFYLELEYAHDFWNVTRRLSGTDFDAELVGLSGPASLKRRSWALGMGWRF